MCADKMADLIVYTLVHIDMSIDVQGKTFRGIILENSKMGQLVPKIRKF